MGTAAPAGHNPELARLDLLRSFKLRMTRPGGNASPFEERVVTAGAGVPAACDVPALHADIRGHIAEAVARVRDRQQSQVVLLSGQAGDGKTHLLRHFQLPATAARHGYVFVGGSNHWEVGEFPACLLDRTVQALTAPSPAGGHLLLDRVRAVGFKAVDQLLENRPAFQRARVRSSGGLAGRVAGWFRGPPHEAAKALAAARDPAVFRLFDYPRFGDEVCDRFLAEPNNPVHRYALRVLLAYLFPDPAGSGVGTAERVVHWLRRRPDDGYFTRRLGIGDDLSRQYAVFDALRLLVHLFSPEVSAELAATDAPCEPRVFLFAFDQTEGRAELFEREEDWLTFFAHLSELYNTLPNVLVLFTMTLHLRNQLHPRMERQFQDRIRMDERFILRNPSPAEVLDLYRSRIDGWLADDPPRREAYRSHPDPHLPLGRDGLLAVAGSRSVRDTLEAFDREFRRYLADCVLSLEPEYDFQFVLNDLRPLIDMQGEYDFTAGHLDTVRHLLAAGWLTGDGPALTEVADEDADGLPVLRLKFEDPTAAAAWVNVYLARLGHYYMAKISPCLELLKNRIKAKHSLWLIRPREFTAEHDRPEQVFCRWQLADAELSFRGLLHLLGRRVEYETAGTWPAVQTIVRREVEKSYLGDLLRHARERSAAIRAGSPAGLVDEPTPAATS